MTAPSISLVAACDRAWGIGRNNRMLWHLPADLAHFKKLTLGHTVVMGSRTYDSIGRALPGRRNIVLSRNADRTFPGAEKVDTPQAALSSADTEQVMVIGGGEIYAAFLPLAKTVYLTRVDAHMEADTFFPALDDREWVLADESIYPADTANLYAMRFQQWHHSGTAV